MGYYIVKLPKIAASFSVTYAKSLLFDGPQGNGRTFLSERLADYTEFIFIVDSIIKVPFVTTRHSLRLSLQRRMSESWVWCLY